MHDLPKHQGTRLNNSCFSHMSKRYLRLHESHIYPFMNLFTLEAIIVFVHGEPLGHPLPGSWAFLSLVRFWRTRKSLCMNRVKSLLSLRCMLLAVLIPGLQIALRAWYSRLSYDQRSITKRMLALEEPVWRETSPEVRAAVTWRDSGRNSLFPAQSRNQKETLLAGWGGSSLVFVTFLM